MNYPDDRTYSTDHEWVSVTDGVARIGVSDFAQNSLGDIVYVDLPSVGDTVSAGEEFGEVESVKSVSEVISPISGEVIAVNEALEDSPEIVNAEPYEGGWMVEVKLADEGGLDALMTAEAYAEFIKG